MKYLLIILALLALSSRVFTTTTTESVFSDVESALDDLVNASKDLFSQRCQAGTISCTAKVYDECSVYAPEMYCENDFPFPSTCANDGAFMNWETGVGKCSNAVDCDTQEDKEIICSQAQLFGEGYNTAIKHDKDSLFVSQYVGFYNSFITIYPYQHTAFEDNSTEQCFLYDPRLRPWYRGAATGSKNIILVVDASGTDSQLNDAAKTIVNQLGEQDWFGVVSYGATASKFQNALVQATSTNKNSALDFIDNITTSAGANIEDAFTKAFEVFEGTDVSEQTGSCIETAILLLNDSVPSAGETNSATLSGSITTLNNNRATIFTYSFGNSADTEKTSLIACENSGITYDVTTNLSDHQLDMTMRQFHDYFALGLERTEPVWSDIYEDYQTQQIIITAAMPIYVTQGGEKLLLGVAGIDVSLNSIKNNSDFDTVVQQRQNNARYGTCSNDFDLSSCQLQLLRQDQNQVCQELLSCESEVVEIDTCENNITANPWVSEYPTGSDGNPVQYTNEQLTVCCPYAEKEEKTTFGANLTLSFAILLVITLLF